MDPLLMPLSPHPQTPISRARQIYLFLCSVTALHVGPSPHLWPGLQQEPPVWGLPSAPGPLSLLSTSIQNHHF